MMKVLFFSDLDSTLIYSHYPKHICVEYNESKEVTYMTSKGIDMLNSLLENKDFYFIPCTLRSYEQASRIDFVKNGKISMIICDNGFSIYANGSLDKEWDNLMKEKLSIYPDNEISYILEEFIKSNNLICRLKINREAFFTLIFDNEDVSSSYYETIIGLLSLYKYKFDLHGRKLYIIPDFLDKSLAVKYICQKYSNYTIITAGDSSVDELFINLGNKRILPLHSSLVIENSIITQSTGINAGEEVLDIVSTLIDS